MITRADVALTKVAVLDSTMAYREAGSPNSPTLLFLHGNPTSSYIWRNIIPLVAPVAHCIAPDLIGFGQSDKPDIEYRFVDHARYLDAFLERAGITSAYIVAQDWGTGLAFHLAARKPEFVRGLAFMEFIRPMPRLKNCNLVKLRSGLHYLQEDHPDVIGANVKEWLLEIGIGSSPKQMLSL